MPNGKPAPNTIVNVGHHHTNSWVLSAGRSRLMVDLGWMGKFGLLAADLKRKDIPLAEITHGFATHFHGDHAGAAQDLKNQGMRLIVTPEQVPYIEAMKWYMKPDDDYTEIRLDDNIVVPIHESRSLLRSLGFDGQFVHTPGHSDDSVTLVLDTGEAFTGDLTWPAMIGPENADAVMASWRALRDLGATTVYPGHGPVRPLPEVE
jgi:glyoxylase-like metal-dependent hydrolase (beta-lactamase superfamily II)